MDAVQDVYKQAMQEALEFLLENQFVQIPHDEHRARRVCRGSGMGLPHSGDVEDIAVLVHEIRFIA